MRKVSLQTFHKDTVRQVWLSAHMCMPHEGLNDL